MESFKVHFLTYFMILSFKIRAMQSRSLKDEEVHNISDQIDDADPSSDAQKCLCFPYVKSGIPITNYFTPDSEDGEQERLVLYFYKKRNSDKLTIFMPSEQKQLLLPDLTYDEGDRLETIAPEQIINLFHKDMGYFIKIPQGIESTFPYEEYLTSDNLTYVTDSENLNVPIDSNQENNEIIVSPENANQYHLSGLVTTEDVSTTSPYIHDNVISSNNNKIMKLALGNDQWHINYNTEATQKSNQPLNRQNKQLQPTYNLPDNNLVSLKDPGHGDPKIPVTSNNPYQHVFSTQVNNLPHINVEQIGSQHIPVVYKHLNVFPKHPGPGGSNPKSRPKFPTHLSPDNNKFLPSLESQNPKINNIPIPPEKENMPAYQTQNYIESTEKYSFPKYIRPLPSYELNGKNPKGIDMSSPNIGNNINSIRYLPSKYKNPIFDDWFIKQIKTLTLKRPSISKVNLLSLKVLLMKALHENGIYMSENGELYDLYGNIFKITNIRLRPILFANPIEYEKLVANNNCGIPHDLPYLEAVLVSIGNPPKILAIIPLRRIIVTKSHSSVIPLDYNNIEFDNTRCGSHDCTQSKLLEESPLGDGTNNEDYDGTSGLIEARSDDIDKESNVIEASDSGNKDSSLATGLKFEYQNLLPPLSPSFRSMYGEDNANTVEDNDIYVKTVDLDGLHPISNKTDDDDSLGIRIIGGNPATSSGTPVSSKGRSGLNMSI